MKNLKFIYNTLLLLIAVSCTDQSTFNNPAIHELENGSFIRFENVGAINPDYPDPQGLIISEKIYDANENTSTFTLSAEGNIGGSLKFAENLITVTSFPSTIDITSQSLADALGVNVSDFAYGDNFIFKGVATRDDGTEFYPESPSVGSRGNTHDNLNNVTNYTSAMTFGFVFFTDCPPIPGDYIIDIYDSYGDGWQGTGILVTLDNDVEHNIALRSPYAAEEGTQEGCINSGDSGSYTLNVPSGTTTWSWHWTFDRFPSEVSFSVTDPNGVEIFNTASPSDNQMLPVINCL